MVASRNRHQLSVENFLATHDTHLLGYSSYHGLGVMHKKSEARAPSSLRQHCADFGTPLLKAQMIQDLQMHADGARYLVQYDRRSFMGRIGPKCLPIFGSVDQRCMPVVHVQSVGWTRGRSGDPGTRASPDGALNVKTRFAASYVS